MTLLFPDNHRDMPRLASEAHLANQLRVEVKELRQQVAELQLVRSSLTQELHTLQRSTASQRLLTLQSQLLASREEIEGLWQSNKRLAKTDRDGRKALADSYNEHLSGEQPVPTSAVEEQDLSGPHKHGLAGGALRKTIQIMLKAHEVLASQSRLIRSNFPPGLSSTELGERARQSDDLAGAPEILHFLLNHLNKVNQDLIGQPGALHLPLQQRRGMAAQPELQLFEGMSGKLRPMVVMPPEGGGGQPMMTVPLLPRKGRAIMSEGHNFMLETVAGLLRKLRTMDRHSFHATPLFESSCQQLCQMFQLFINEVRWLQGKPSREETPSFADTLETDNSSDATLPTGPWTDDLLSPTSASMSSPSLSPKARFRSAPSSKALGQSPRPQRMVSYSVFVTTSDISGGAFDGAVFIAMHGTNGSSGEIRLPSDRCSFDTGEENEFQIPSLDIGEVRSITVRMEVTDLDATWHLQKVRLESSEACNGRGLDTTYHYENWVQPSVRVMLFPKAESAMRDYEVIVRTADARGSGVGPYGCVEIKIIGENGASDWLELADEPASFRRGGVGRFSVSAPDVGNLTSVVLRLAGVAEKDKGKVYTGWKPERIDVLHVSLGWKSVFYCNQWITSEDQFVLLYESETEQVQGRPAAK